ncbi:unnamed protein product, partial [marine sediment metagenome]
DVLCESSKTWGQRIWEIAKAAALLIVGYVLAIRRN